VSIEDELKIETIKWLECIKDKLKKVNSSDKYFMDNIKAYISDTEYFLKKGDLIRAFECVVWAWAWMEIGIEIGKIYDK
jgi:hypothetical protein